MHVVDVGLAVPPLIVLLVLAAALSPGAFIVVVAVALAQIPGLIRIVRAAAAEVFVQSYVESARLRGMGSFGVAVREVLPNISRTLTTDLGFRFTVSVLAIAAANYLGLGLQPPNADWGLMVSENQSVVQINPWPLAIPALLVALLTVGANLFMDGLTTRSRSAEIEGTADPALLFPTPTKEGGG
jgi:ABC-type dipeptide/oligopeptide/nickel transport system permease subunit